MRRLKQLCLAVALLCGPAGLARAQSQAGQQFDAGFLAQIETDAVAAKVTAGTSTAVELRIR